MNGEWASTRLQDELFRFLGENGENIEHDCCIVFIANTLLQIIYKIISLWWCVLFSLADVGYKFQAVV